MSRKLFCPYARKTGVTTKKSRNNIVTAVLDDHLIERNLIQRSLFLAPVGSFLSQLSSQDVELFVLRLEASEVLLGCWDCHLCDTGSCRS